MKFMTVLMSGFLTFAVAVTNLGAGQESSLAKANIGVVAGDPVDELGNNLMLVFQDRKNNFWFATWGDGLYRFDGKSTVHFTTKHGLCHDRIDEIVEDPAGNLYFNTSAGINRFDGTKFSTLPVANKSE